MLKNFWNDEAGVIVSAELVLVLTILVIGMVVGLASVRDAVVAELADVAQAIANVNQSYSYCAIDGHASFTNGSSFNDTPDFCDGADDTTGQTSKCVTICGANTGTTQDGSTSN